MTARVAYFITARVRPGTALLFASDVGERDQKGSLKPREQRSHSIAMEPINDYEAAELPTTVISARDQTSSMRSNAIFGSAAKR